MKKLILHVIPSLEAGGAERILVNLVSSSDSFRHVIFCLKPRSKNDLSIENDCVEIIQPANYGYFSSLFVLLRTLRKLRKAPPLVIQGWMYHGSLSALISAILLRKSKLIWSIHHFDPCDNTLRLTTRWLIWLLAKLSKGTDSIIYCASSARSAHESFGFEPSKSHVIFNGYDTERFRPNDEVRRHLRTKLGVADYFVVALIGRFHPVKGHVVLMEAFSHLESGAKIKFLFAGRGLHAKDNFAQTVKSLYPNSDQFIFLGEIGNVPEILNAVDLVVLPSYNEALPNIIAESMATATCCIATYVGDIPQLIGSRDFLIQPGDVVALSAHISEQFRIWNYDKVRWLEQGCRLRQRIKSEYSEIGMVQKYETLWR